MKKWISFGEIGDDFDWDIDFNVDEFSELEDFGVSDGKYFE